MTRIMLIPLWVALFLISNLMAFEEDPRIEEHNKLTDRLLALGDEQCHLKLYEEYLRIQDRKIREESAKKEKEVASEEIID